MIHSHEKWYMSVNVTKTKYMCIAGNGYNLILEEILTHANNIPVKEIAERITKEKTIIGTLNQILWSNYISKLNKKETYIM